MNIISQTYPKAKKLHLCDSCLSRINIDETYYRQVNDFDGFGMFKSHLICKIITDLVYDWDMHRWDYWDFGLPKMTDLKIDDFDVLKTNHRELFELWKTQELNRRKK